MTRFLFLVSVLSTQFFWPAHNATAQTQTPAPASALGVVPNYFQFPIMPGGANSLSGGLGDLRPNHFHAGLDIRTGGREGLPVYAAADGYISRIGVTTGGYGNVLFIKHPNGMTTVYGHLKSLADTLGRYLRASQYARQTFEIDLRPTPGQFPVKQGQVIALSGNTGGSGGPHLHFEIRDQVDNLINPLLYGFEELEDNLPPYVERIALRTMTPEARLNGEYTRRVFTPTRLTDGSYTISQPITASGLLGLEVLAYDKTGGSPYRNGVNCMEIKLDGREVFAYNMNSFPHEQTRYINVHMDYETEQITGQRYHRAYVANGNRLSLYKTVDAPEGPAYRGRLPLFDGKPHEVTVTLSDVYENTAVLRFTLLPEPPAAARLARIIPSGLPTQMTVTTDGNVLKMSARNLPDTLAPTLTLLEGDRRTELPVSYVRNNQAVFLIDLQKQLPDRVQLGSAVLATNLRRRIIPGRAELYSEPNLNLLFAPSTLFDTLHLATKIITGGFEINQGTIPLNESLTGSFRPDPGIWRFVSQPDSTGTAPNLARTQVYLTNGGGRKNLGGTWKNGRIEFSTRELGQFRLLTDTRPPVVQVIAKTKAYISARISDDLSGIQSWRAMVGEQWVLMQYDYKRALLWSEKFDPAVPFAGELKLEVTDRAGNKTVITGMIQ